MFYANSIANLKISAQYNDFIYVQGTSYNFYCVLLCFPSSQTNNLSIFRKFGTESNVWLQLSRNCRIRSYLHKYISHKYRVFFFLWIQSGGCKSAILRSFKQFLYFLHSKIWAHFHFGTFDPKE